MAGIGTLGAEFGIVDATISSTMRLCRISSSIRVPVPFRVPDSSPKAMFVRYFDMVTQNARSLEWFPALQGSTCWIAKLDPGCGGFEKNLWRCGIPISRFVERSRAQCWTSTHTESWHEDRPPFERDSLHSQGSQCLSVHPGLRGRCPASGLSY